MRSNARSRMLDLARGLPTTAEDVQALRRARKSRPLDIEQYLRFLEQLPYPSYDALRRKRGARGDRPFVIS